VSKFRLFLILSVFLALVFLVFKIQEPRIGDLKGEVTNFIELEKGVAGGGLLSDEAIRTAAGQGYKTIIDIRSPQEGIQEQKKLVESLGMRYVNIPVGYGRDLTPEADRLAEVLSDKAAKPAFVFCRSGNRARLLWSFYQKRGKK